MKIVEVNIHSDLVFIGHGYELHAGGIGGLKCCVKYGMYLIREDM